MIYLDNAATTQIANEVLTAMQPYLKDQYGNASSLHKKGQEAKEALENSRKKIADLLKCSPEEIIFTSGGSESDNLAIKGITYKHKSGHIITSKIEHPAVLETCKHLEKQDYEVTYLNVNKEGIIDLNQLKNSIKNNTILVTIMHSNNEIGTIQPIDEIKKICKDIPFHSDAIQSFGKIPIDIKNFDLISISSHKIHGPKGIGALYIRKGIKLDKLIDGGSHEFNLRAGTENIPAIVGFAKASETMFKEINNKKVINLRDKLIKCILEIKDSWINGSLKNRLPNNVNVSFKNIEGEALVLRLDSKGIAASTGSACSTKTLKPSHVLLAIGLKPEESHGSLRLTLSRYTTEKEIDKTIIEIKKIIKELRDITPFGG